MCTALNGNTTRPSSVLYRTPQSRSARTSAYRVSGSRPTRLASSRTENAPAPAILRTSCQRSGVISVNKCSALGKLIRGVCFSPRKAAWARPSVSSNEETPKVTVTISSLTSSNLRPEISQKGVNGGEGIGYFSLANVLVIPFSCFIVIAQHTSVLDYIRQSVLKEMRRACYRRWHSPDHKLDERIMTEPLPVIQDRSGLHSIELTSPTAFLSTCLTRLPGVPS